MSTRPDSGDEAYLWDIRHYGQEILDVIRGKSLGDYMSERGLQLAVERGLEIVGEASRLLSSELRTANANVPWSSIIGLRNVLAHDYGRIEPARIWTIASVRIPELLKSLDNIQLSQG